MKKAQLPEQKSSTGKWVAVIVIIVLLGMVSLFTALIIGLFIVGSDAEPSGNVAQISIDGVIVAKAPKSFMSSGFSDVTEMIKLIEKADKNPEIKAILFEINSGGGSAVASWELQRAIKESNKTTVAWIREGGASGAYWAATATDYIIASPISITGSVGVLASYIDFSGTLNRYNASYQRLVSGKYKDMGTPLKPMTEEEEAMYQKSIDVMRDFFAGSVAEYRNIPKNKMEELAQGQFFIGVDAKELGLIDALGGKKEAIKWIEQKEDIKVKIAEYRKPKSLGEILAGTFSGSGYDMGRGIGDSLMASDDLSIRT